MKRLAFVWLNLFFRQASIAKASEICPDRSDVRRTAKSLDSEISRLKHKINTQQDQQGHRDTIVRYKYHKTCQKNDRMIFHLTIKERIKKNGYIVALRLFPLRFSSQMLKLSNPYVYKYFWENCLYIKLFYPCLNKILKHLHFQRGMFPKCRYFRIVDTILLHMCVTF